MSSVIADCPYLPPNILQKSTPELVLLFTDYCGVPQFLLHVKISFSVQKRIHTKYTTIIVLHIKCLFLT